MFKDARKSVAKNRSSINGYKSESSQERKNSENPDGKKMKLTIADKLDLTGNLQNEMNELNTKFTELKEILEMSQAES